VVVSTPRPITVEVDEVVVHGVRIATPAAFGDEVGRCLASLLAERGLPGPEPERVAAHESTVRMSGPDDLAALATGVAHSIWAELRAPSGTGER
jgi:hypothetical protein